VGDSTLRILFARVTELLIDLREAPKCMPGWRYLHHGACDSLNQKEPCVIDAQSAGGTRLTFVWAYNQAEFNESHVLPDVSTQRSKPATGDSHWKSMSSSPQTVYLERGKRQSRRDAHLFGRFAAKSSAALRAILAEAEASYAQQHDTQWKAYLDFHVIS